MMIHLVSKRLLCARVSKIFVLAPDSRSLRIKFFCDLPRAYYPCLQEKASGPHGQSRAMFPRKT